MADNDFDFGFNFDIDAEQAAPEQDFDFDFGFDFGNGEKSEEYSALRSGVVDFVESATGWGTELDALARRLGGSADTFEEAHRQSLADVAYYEEDNQYANYLSTGAGFAAGFLIPSLAFAKVGTVATTAQKAGAAWKAAGLGAVEGAIYGAGTGHTLEERAQGAALGGAVGGALSGGLGYKFLIKSDEELAAAAKKVARQKGKGSHLGGEEGFKAVEQASGPASVNKTSGQGAKGIYKIDDEAIDLGDDLKKAAGSVWNLGRSTKAYLERHVGGRFAKLAEDAETMSRRGRFAVDHALSSDEALGAASKTVMGSPNLKNILVRLNPEIADDASRLKWDEAMKLAANNEERTALLQLKNYVKQMQLHDPRNLKVGADGKLVFKSTDYFPTQAIKKINRQGGAARTEDYIDPIESLRQYAYDVQDAIEMGNRFGVAPADVIKHATVKGSDGGMKNSLVESVILAVKDRAKRDTPDILDSTLANMEIGLRAQFVAARKGGNSVGSVVRRATSTALLANPMNAVLNMVEGITAPIYQNGLMAWMETVPEAVVSTFRPAAAAKGATWIGDASTGHGGQWMGELTATGMDAIKKGMDDMRFLGIVPEQQAISEGVDKLGKVAYKYTGVDTVNRMGREMLGNSAIKRGMKLAVAGDEKSYAKLLKHDGMRGLTETEARSTAAALRKMSKEGKDSLSKLEFDYIHNFYGAALNKWQPVSASALPRAFHENPNGRMFYSMLSYMNRQMNNIVDDIGYKMVQAKEVGLNTKEGQALMLEAYKNGAKYMALFGVLAGTWNTARLGLDPSKDKPFSEVFTVEGMSEAAINDLASNVTTGLLNLRSPEYGKKVGSIESIIPAPLSAAGNLASGALSMAGGMLEGEGVGEASEQLRRAAQTYVPGVSNVDRMFRMATGNRLLTDEGTGVGYLNDPLKAVGIENRAQGLFEDLGLDL